MNNKITRTLKIAGAIILGILMVALSGVLESGRIEQLGL